MTTRQIEVGWVLMGSDLGTSNLASDKTSFAKSTVLIFL